MEKTYNGWKNRETWNCALWIQNDENLYNAACEYVQKHKTQKALYRGFIYSMGMDRTRTPDGILWDGARLDYAALNEMMRELIS